MGVDPDQLSCNNPDCKLYGRMGAGNIHVHCRADRRYYCTACKKRFCARAGTIFYNLKTDPERVLTALQLISERCSARATARILHTNEDTVLSWLKLAGNHAQEVQELLLRDLKVSQVQLDELWSFVGKKRWVGKAAISGSPEGRLLDLAVHGRTKPSQNSKSPLQNKGDR